MPAPSTRPPRARPGIEPLERRDVPSVAFAFSDGVLKVDGGLAAEQIAINDQGDGTLKVYNAGAFQTFEGVTAVKVSMGGGNDRVNHILQGDQVKTISYDINLGTGDDEFTTDVVDRRISAAVLGLSVHGDTGNDRLYASVSGASVALGSYVLWLDGEAGDDFIQALVTDTDVNAGAFNGLYVDADGGFGRDEIKVLYRGDNDAAVQTNVRGGGDEDVLTADVTFDFGSTGVMTGLVDGGTGDDKMEFFVRKGRTDPIKVGAKLLGGSGRDTGTISAGFVQYDDSTESLFIV